MPPPKVNRSVNWRAKPSPMKGRPALVLSASPGLAGGSRGAWALRVPLELNGMLVYPGMFSLPQAHEAFAEDGGFRDGKQGERLDRLVAEFLEYARRLTS